MSDGEPAFDRELDVLPRSRLLATTGALLTFLGVPSFLAFLARVFPPGILGLHLAVFGALILYGVAWRNVRPSRRRLRVRATRAGIEAGARAIPRTAITDGFFQPRRYGARYRSSVRLLGSHRRVLFETEVADENEAIALLRAVGFDARSHRAEFHGSSPIYATLPRQMAWTFGLGFAFVALSVFFGRMIHGAVVLPLLIVPAVFLGMIPSRIVVGVDGLVVRWLWQTRFIPMAQIRAAYPVDDRGIALALTNGEEILHTSMRQRYRSQEAPQHRDAVLARIHEAMRAHAEHGAAVDVSALVARGGRTHGEWLDALRGLRRTEGGGYRSVALRADDLFRLVEDPSAPEDVRAGAAMILSGSLDADGRARVRVAAEATASPKLRVALDAASAEADARLEKALAEIADDDASASANASADARRSALR